MTACSIPLRREVNDRDALTISSQVGETLLQADADIEEFGALFDQLAEWADFGEAAAETARRIADEYRSL